MKILVWLEYFQNENIIDPLVYLCSDMKIVREPRETYREIGKEKVRESKKSI